AVLHDGSVEQIGTPEQIYDQPASAFVYDFLGNVNLFHGQSHGGSVKIGDTEYAVTEKGGPPEMPAVAFVRPTTFASAVNRADTPRWRRASSAATPPVRPRTLNCGGSTTMAGSKCN